MDPDFRRAAVRLGFVIRQRINYHLFMRRHIDRVLLDRRTIADRVAELADQIARDLKADPADPEPALVIVPLLTGSVIFLADLMRQLPLMMRIRLLTVQSYPGKSTTSQGVTIEEASLDDLAGKHVLMVDDVLDSGRTIQAVGKLIHEQQPASLRTCVLLRKQRPEAMAIEVDYIGFDIPNEFIVGYGLDYDGYYRNLPEVVTLREEAMR